MYPGEREGAFPTGAQAPTDFSLAGEAQMAIRALVSDKGLATSEHYQMFARDMSKSGNIARTARKLQAQKNGKAWLARVKKGG